MRKDSCPRSYIFRVIFLYYFPFHLRYSTLPMRTDAFGEPRRKKMLQPSLACENSRRVSLLFGLIRERLPEIAVDRRCLARLSLDSLPSAPLHPGLRRDASATQCTSPLQGPLQLSMRRHAIRRLRPCRTAALFGIQEEHQRRRGDAGGLGFFSIPRGAGRSTMR